MNKYAFFLSFGCCEAAAHQHVYTGIAVALLQGIRGEIRIEFTLQTLNADQTSIYYCQ